MTQADIFLRFGVAIAIGFLIGLQREFAKGGQKKTIVAGERTFALLSLVSCLGAMVSDQLRIPLIFVAIVILIGILAGVSYFVAASTGHVGMTTEVAIVISVLIGGLCYWGNLGLTVAIGIATTTILYLKVETDRLVGALTREDIAATLELAVICAIVLPVLPNRAIFVPPFDLLNLFKIWDYVWVSSADLANRSILSWEYRHISLEHHFWNCRCRCDNVFPGRIIKIGGPIRKNSSKGNCNRYNDEYASKWNY
jgi:hypothetical protein